jgi:hypothetical protein
MERARRVNISCLGELILDIFESISYKQNVKDKFAHISYVAKTNNGLLHNLCAHLIVFSD